MARVRGKAGDRHLVGAERALDRLAVDVLWAGPPFGRAKDDHRPARASWMVIRVRLALDARDLVERPVQPRSHLLMHPRRIVAAHDHRRMAVAAHQLYQP